MGVGRGVAATRMEEKTKVIITIEFLIFKI